MAARIVDDSPDEWGRRVVTIELDPGGVTISLSLDPAPDRDTTLVSFPLPDGASLHAPALLFYLPHEGKPATWTIGGITDAVDRVIPQLPEELAIATSQLARLIAEYYRD